ncbi:MAG: hypothetical protein ABI418_06415, partial [Jatrophihabitantaceae bacterium]
MTDQPTDSTESANNGQPAEVSQPGPGWSAAQQYPFHPQGAYGGYPPAGSYVQDGPYSQYAPSGEPAPFGGYQPQYPTGQYPTGQYPGNPYGPAQYGAGQYPTGPYGNSSYPAGSYGPGGPYGGGPLPPGPDFWSPPPVPPKSRSHRLVYGSVAAAVAAALAIGGIALAVDHANKSSNQQTSLSTPTQQGPLSGNGNDGSGLGLGNGLGGGDDGSAGSGTTGTTGQASSAQQVGIVDINTTLDYGQGKAAGTGLVLTGDGEILTNNHVV